MSELLPYEEQLAGRLANLPLPDEDKGWDAMRKMLDDDDANGVVPPPVSTGCRRWGLGLLLLLLLAGITWGVYKTHLTGAGNATRDNSMPNKQLGTQKDSLVAGGHKDDKSDTSISQSAVSKQGGSQGTKISDSIKKPDKDSRTYKALKGGANRVDTINVLNKTGIVSKPSARFRVKNAQMAQGITDEKNTANKTGVFTIKEKSGVIRADKYLAEKSENTLKKTNSSDSLKNIAAKEITVNKTKTTSIIAVDNSSKAIITKLDTISQVKHKPAPEKYDTAASQKKLHYKTNDTVVRDNTFYLSAGLGLQQLIPIDGQKSSPYNAFGRKGSLADYIPSAYFRVHKNRAFLQVEFKYGAPQYTKDIAYSTKVISHDTATQITTSQVNHVSKTYYHQLPLSVHYQILPNLSIGAGAVLNKFQSAVVTQQNHASNGLTGTDTIVASKVINVKSDSAFAKTYWQFMLETQYTWRRFSFGARYAWGLTPYLTATSSTGQTQKERNASFNVFVRYELWRSKKK